MNKLSFFVTCQCKHPNKIPWIDELAGKKRQVTCRKCKLRLKVEFPNSAPDNTTIIPNAKRNVSIGGYLELLENEFAKASNYPLKKRENKVGRFSNNGSADVPLLTTDKRISRHHFAIKIYDHGIGAKKFTIRSLPNTNGTRLNNKLLTVDQEVYLKDGDKIKIGDSKIIFKAYI